ncbi:MAG: heparinase II/III family protein, partial [Candidatus Eisenbacteria sp.]|nr:heparinase II/III family protein [Candidatus Eisenbacteria bacterium]
MMRCTGLWMLVVALFLVAGVLGSCQRAPDATDMAGRLDMTGRPDWSAVADTPGAAQLTPYRFLAIRKCAVPPVIDGKLDDVCWNSAEQASDFVLLHADRAAEQQTTAYLAYDDFRIYFGFMCAERQIDEIVAEEREHDALVCHDDCVELFLDLNRDYLNYFHFIVNSLGVTSDASVELVDDFIDVYYDWEPEYDVSAAQGDGYWVVEMAIPFTSLKTGVARPSIYGERKREEESALTLLESPRVDTGTVWNINLCRRKPGEGGELSSWAPVCDKFYSPYQFGHLAFADNLAPGDVSLLRHNAQRIHARVVLEERRREQERLKPILDEIDSYVSNCNWVATYRRNMFLGYQSEDGEFGIPNYARRDGQGRVVLQEAFPPLSKEIIEGIAAKETPRLVFDRESLAELQGKIHTCPRIGAQWLTLQGEVDQLLEEAICGFEPCEMQWDRNCVARDKAKRAGAGYGLLCTMRSKCALAYGITGDRRYAEKTWEAQKALIEHFARYQVFRAASNWYSIWDASYEVYTSTYVYDMIADAGVMTQKEKGELIEFIRRLGYSVDYCVKHSAMIGNHQFMWTGNFGCLVSYFPEFPEHERWARDVEARMAALYADILRDGGQVERSPGHHVFGLSFLCRYVNTRRHVTGEDHFARKYDGRSLEMAVDWMAKIATPLGEIPAINDSKRPKLSSHTFVLDVVNRFNKGEYLVAGKIETENLPLEHLISESVVPAEPEYASVLLPDTGWAIMRDSWSKDSRYLLFDYGPHGAWHGHYDKMNIVMYADGVGWVLDAGASPHYCVYIKEHNE